ncbi:multiple inositol polyphosphate phosphatase 1 [Bacillus rossius redtenbacheri]|uniref:multiple inositol polyphosphate phosphatase 1 n=1 Tax=Bacillus rossius redtenbacheri TaxID=93214 RepID=UPI002FDEF0FB
MEWMSKLVVLVLACSPMESLSETDFCHSKGMNLHHLATKTPYRFVRHDDSSTNYPDCEPVRAWMIVRHGTRYPGSKAIQKMVHSLPLLRNRILAANKAGKGSLCREEVSALERWACGVEEADEKRLAHEGEDEMLELAERFQQRFPRLFPGDYRNDTYKFKHTATQRAGESARYFTVGLFGRRVSRHVWFPEALHRDPILRFYKACPRWKREVDKNPDSVQERNKFARGPEMKQSLEEIRARLGLDASLEFDDVHLLYVTCSFETAWDKRRPSPWCAAFSEKDLQVFEYFEDLEYYWIDGYGFNLTYRQACPAIRDMMNYLQTGRTPGSQHSPRAVVYFSHSGSLLKILAHLGLYRDGRPPRHDNYRLMGERRWRVSHIDAFGTNLAFVLLSCGGESRVLTLHQERPVALPGCPASGGHCPLAALLHTYHASVHACDFEGMCRDS